MRRKKIWKCFYERIILIIWYHLFIYCASSAMLPLGIIIFFTLQHLLLPFKKQLQGIYPIFKICFIKHAAIIIFFVISSLNASSALLAVFSIFLFPLYFYPLPVALCSTCLPFIIFIRLFYDIFYFCNQFCFACATESLLFSFCILSIANKYSISSIALSLYLVLLSIKKHFSYSLGLSPQT